MFHWAFVSWVMAFSRTSAADVLVSDYDITYGCDIIYGDVIETFNTCRSLRECSVKCSENTRCLALKYNSFTKICQLNSERYFSLTTACSDVVTYAQIDTDSHRFFVNEACSETSECTVHKSQCVDNKCQCMAGYSYRYGNESCLTACDVYGSTFRVFPGRNMLLLNDKFITNIATMDICQQRCVAENTFVCRSIDYWPENNYCYLSVETAWTKPKDFVRTAALLYGHRNCQ